jgi:hypothetical protein
MLKPNTVQQLLEVFRLFRENFAATRLLHDSFQEAVRKVAETYSVTYQTIGDGCRRRLELTDINELYEMLSSWVERGEPRTLVHQLKKHSDPITHSQIEKIFSSPESTTPPKPKPSTIPAGKDFEAVTFRLGEPDARLLRAIAELEGISVGELTARVVSTAMRERMKAVAREFMEE